MRRHRIAAELSQGALAERARISVQAVGALERGDRRSPHRETLALLADALGLDDQTRMDFEAAALSAIVPRTGAPALDHTDSASGSAALPSLLTSFVGRANDVAQIASLLRNERLVTLTGPGGIGKTRTAIEISHAFADEFPRVHVVELAPLNDEQLVTEAIASALELHLSPRRSAMEIVQSHLQGKRALLVLDNCEHVVAATARVCEELLRTCPLLRVLATSREPLRIAGEHTYRLRGLGAPALHDADRLTGSRAQNFPAVVLFVQRARAANHDFALNDETATPVGEICARLDGIPLAIELAAARASAFSVTAIAEKLRRRFALLAHGNRTAPTRHRTMYAAVEWSYELLSASERDLFDRLGIFAGDWTLDVVTEVCAQDGANERDVFELLCSLVDKSLVIAEVTGTEPRYRMLETFRHFALERLGSRPDARAIAHRHAQAYLAYGEQLGHDFDRSSDDVVMARLRAQLDNFRAALCWSLEARNHVVLGQRLATAISPSFEVAAPADLTRWMTLAYRGIDDATPPDVVAQLQLWAAVKTTLLGDGTAVSAAVHRAISVLEEAGDVVGAARARFVAGQLLFYSGRLAEAEPLLQSSVETAQAEGALRFTGVALLGLGRVYAASGKSSAAHAAYSQALATSERCGNALGVAHAVAALADGAFRDADCELALRRGLKALEIYRARDDVFFACFVLNNVAAYLIELDRFAEALSYAREALFMTRRAALTDLSFVSVQHIATAAACDGENLGDRHAEQARRAARLLGYVDARYRDRQVGREYTEQRGYDRACAALAAALPADERVAAMRRGAALTEDEAEDEALAIQIEGYVEFARELL